MSAAQGGDVSTILLVDDDPETLRALTAVLSEFGEVVPFAEGASAIAFIRDLDRALGLVVSDLRLPDTSGIAVISEARALRPDVPALLLSGRAEMSDLADAINLARVYRYLPKPVDVDDLRHTVMTALETGQLRRDRDRLHGELSRSNAALRILFEAARELSHAPQRGDVAAAALTHFARAVPFTLGGLLVAPAGVAAPSLYLQTAAPADPDTLSEFRERILAYHEARSQVRVPRHELRLSLLGAASPPSGPIPDPLYRTEVTLEAGRTVVGAVQLLCTRAPSSEEGRLLAALATEVAQALGRVEALSAAHARELSAIVESLGDGLLVVGVEESVTLVNPAARALLGVGSDEAVDAATLANRLGFDPFDVLRTWEQEGPRLVRREASAGVRTIDAVVSPILDAGGVVSALTMVLRDVTAERDLERRKEEFVSVVSHEMRTPLASISGSLELVLRGFIGELSDKQRHYLTLARDGCARLHSVVDDLLDMAKFERGRLDVDVVSVDLASVLREVSDHYHGAATERDATLVCDVPHAPPEFVAGDGARLFQVLNNLLSNALKFVRGRGMIEVASLSSVVLTDFVGFTVWNTGPSVPDAELEQMFEKFRQLPGARRRIGGTGLGLPIARGIMESHGGRLWAKRGVKDGVRFVGILPRAEGGESPRVPPLDGDVVRLCRDALAGVKGEVLIAHEDPRTAWLMKGALLRYGVPARTVESFDELEVQAAFGDALAFVVDAALCGPGLERVRALRDRDEGGELPPFLTIGEGAVDLPGVESLSGAFVSAELVRAISRVIAVRSRARPMRVLLVTADAMNQGARELAAFAEAGVEAEVAATVEEAALACRRRKPDAIVADVGDDGRLGFDVARALVVGRADAPALICMSSSTGLAVKVRAFREGASDYVLRPADPRALVERIRAVVARRQASSDALSTGLPAAHMIEREVRRRISSGRPFAYLEVTIDRLRAFAEQRGYAIAESVVRQAGEVVREAVFASGAPSDFAGHAERDHFVVVTAPERADAIGERIALALARALPLYRDAAGQGGADPDGSSAPSLVPRVVALIDPGGRFSEPAAVASAAKVRRARAGAAVYVRDDGDGG